MALNTLFPRQKELVNYDYFDIAEGVGYVVYYGFKGDDEEYFTSTTSQIFSSEICSLLAQTAIPTSATKKFDLDFDITFNRPKNVKGKIIANIPIGMAANTAGSVQVEYYAIVKAIHYDGSTETLLATGTSRTVGENNLHTGQTAFSANIMVCVMEVTTMKHFKKGETLRFIVEGWFSTQEASEQTENVMICHDPKNRVWKNGVRPGEVYALAEFANEVIAGGTVTYQNTQMIFHVPFVLDI